MSCQIKTPWKKVIHVHPLDNFCLELIWEDGMTSVIELNELIPGISIRSPSTNSAASSGLKEKICHRNFCYTTAVDLPRSYSAQ
jgi:hypothetical protein